ncbi:hypothetical protein [Tatumella sp. JGM118]|uniref:hypothetical protein n=1 Tax=Tatumella sp. JGM118 TaxID=2799796 RepID=UPI001BB09892|nr:hypothetical protein [Tatumella sp. JGM118]MBS0908106.1 hypothetical protein [Tatumella sp. JGM118]
MKKCKMQNAKGRRQTAEGGIQKAETGTNADKKEAGIESAEGSSRKVKCARKTAEAGMQRTSSKKQRPEQKLIIRSRHTGLRTQKAKDGMQRIEGGKHNPKVKCGERAQTLKSRGPLTHGPRQNLFKKHYRNT